jgi:hypothetical protein
MQVLSDLQYGLWFNTAMQKQDIPKANLAAEVMLRRKSGFRPSSRYVHNAALVTNGPQPTFVSNAANGNK